MVKDKMVIWYNECECGVPVCVAVCDTKEHAETLAEAWELIWKEANEHCDDEEHELYDVDLDVDFIDDFVSPFNGVELIVLDGLDGNCVTTSF